MILIKSDDIAKKNRNIRTVNITLDEKPKRPEYHFRTEKDLVKFTKGIEMMVRGSMEYQEYIKFLHTHMDFNRCAVLQNICKSEGKKYTIEIHHEPFNLFQIVQIVIAKQQMLGKDLNKFEISNEVMKLHYDGKVGLIPLSATQHKLVHDGRVFIPMQLIYQDYIKFADDYDEYIPNKIRDLIMFKVQMSQKCDKIQSDVLSPEFVYLDVDGFSFPAVPDEWGIRKQALEDAIMNPVELPPDSPSIYRPGDDISVK